MPPVVDLEAVWNFATALLIGALLGIERERHKREHDEQTSAACVPSSCSR